MLRSALQALNLAACACLLLASGAVRASDDEAQLRQLLDWFLAGAHDVAVHERFWAEDLVYTSSNGTRTDREAILEGMKAAPDDGLPAPGYSAADVDVRLYDDIAVVAFRLVATPAAGTDTPSEYYNTGTFRKRGGEWRVIAWQATRIPAADDASGE